MDFARMSDGIRPFHSSHHVGHDDHSAPLPVSTALHFSVIDPFDHGGWAIGRAPLTADVHAGGGPSPHVRMAGPADKPGKGSADPAVQADQHAPAKSGPLAQSGNHDNAVTKLSSIGPAAASAHIGGGPALVETGGDAAGNGGDGYSYGGIIHASIVIYAPINISVSAGYGSIALANQTNNLNVDQSAVQIAGVGGGGGSGNVATGGNIDLDSFTAGAIATGANGAGNGGDGHFSGTLLDAPIVIYKPINIAIAGPGGTAYASQSNTVAIDQSVIQIAGVGGHGGDGNAAVGGNVSATGSGPGGGMDTGGGHAGNGGDGSFSGSLVHTSVVVYDPINISVAGYSSSSYAYQYNNVQLDQFAFQMAGIGGNGGNGNLAMGGHAGSSGLWGGSDAIATGANHAGNGGNGYFSGSLVDVSIAIYAPINIAVAGPHATAVADQINNVHIDQSAVQIAGVGGHGGDGNLAIGGDLAAHLLSDLHLLA